MKRMTLTILMVLTLCLPALANPWLGLWRSNSGAIIEIFTEYDSTHITVHSGGKFLFSSYVYPTGPNTFKYKHPSGDWIYGEVLGRLNSACDVTDHKGWTGTWQRER